LDSIVNTSKFDTILSEKDVKLNSKDQREANEIADINHSSCKKGLAEGSIFRVRIMSNKVK
jgi:hypothetical protein